MICNKCGHNVAHNATYCTECGNPISRRGNKSSGGGLKAVYSWEEKHPLGVLGALGGTVLTIGFSLLAIQYSVDGWMMTLIGLVLSVLVLGGWWQLAGRIGTLGKAVCITLMALGGWFIDWMIWMIDYLYRHMGIGATLVEAFFGVPEIILSDPSVTAYYLFELMFLYEGALIGSAVILVLHHRVSDE